MGMNLVVLTGRLTADPELKYTQSGKALVRFALAVSRAYNKNETDFITCIAWERRAEIISEYLKKGSMIGVQGSISVRTYEDEKNQKRKITEVRLDNFEFLDSKKTGNNSDNETNNKSSNEASKSASTSSQDEDFPF